MSQILKDTFHLQLNVNADGTDRTDPFNAGTTYTITGATGTTPITVTVSEVITGLSNGDLVFITGVGGCTAANGWHEVANKNEGAKTFELRYATLNAAYTSGGTATLNPDRFTPVFPDGFQAFESVSRVDVPTEHKDRGIRYAVPGDRNRQARQLRCPIFPDNAGFLLRMASRMHATTNLPYYHTARQWWTGTLAGADPYLGLEFSGVLPTGWSITVNRQTIGPLELTVDFFINAMRGLNDGSYNLPTIPNATTGLGWPDQDPYITSNLYVDLEFADTDGAFTAWTGNRTDIRNITITANENPELDISSPNDDVALDNSWTHVYLGTPTVDLDVELVMSDTAYLAITQMSDLRKARCRFMAVGRTPGSTTSTTNLAASGTSLTVGNNADFHVGDKLLLSQATANKQQVVTCEGLTGSTTITISAALIAMDGSGGDTIKVRNTAFQIMVHSADCSDPSGPQGGGAVKVVRFKGSARLTPSTTTLYTILAYDDDNAGKTPT